MSINKSGKKLRNICFNGAGNYGPLGVGLQNQTKFEIKAQRYNNNEKRKKKQKTQERENDYFVGEQNRNGDIYLVFV